MDAWFSNAQKVNVDTLGKKYILTDYGVKTDSTLIQTKAIQAVIDRAAQDGGGVIVVPTGTYQSGALFFKPKTHLYVSEGGKLKGSDRIANFPVVETRIEGETCKYFSAFINADKCDGFTIAGPGTIDGNGYHYWEEFWIRRTWNRECTNKDAQRPRLVYISNSSNVTLQDVHIQNSPFWTNHIYRCDHVRFLNCTIFAPTSGMKAPSSDAIDIDVCHDVLVDGCEMSVNDDAIAIKGGKGTWADQSPENGPVYNVLIQRCNYGKVHGCLTLGSESVSDRQPWAWITDKLLSEIAQRNFRYPFDFDTIDDIPVLCVRTSHVMAHISTTPTLREFWDGLPVKSDRVYKKQLHAAGVLMEGKDGQPLSVERTIGNARVSNMVAMPLSALRVDDR